MPATPAWPPRSAPRLFVPGPLARGAQVEPDSNQTHYLLRVMRLGPGDAVVLCDDETGEWSARVIQADRRHIALEVVENMRGREATPDFWLCAALLKKDRYDLVLEKATELGVAAIRPLLTRRCVAGQLNLARARTVVVEAAEQCARTALPRLHTPEPLPALLADWPAERLLFFADEAGDAPPALRAFSRAPSSPAALLVGPEGGFDTAERALIRGLPQARPVTLGPRILRGETAAIAATALWMGAAGDWAKPRDCVSAPDP
ncbi:16S rRNA (uracil(1498)-N(3))-methyltransferase [Erythrobacteraceae bacterium CFH 75059]|uniref:16S rRNA (uracil(1498)-N(3))-methyltransferase n=1 Tax=Qipengyuania thermophila TaxID=2509361 RepID=UPI00101FF11C|nr:16S rRNA (uracil(1498)-N(3))-methyltransferase [Qipengyuania thermophila]TCD04963.1 16S rRNA (uracil(1498)-N(3))-methyltransferase [Erythrobacteraceae bacterium CFH 75059]